MPKVSELYTYNEDIIREAVDIVIGDDGMRSAEVIEVLRYLKLKMENTND